MTSIIDHIQNLYKDLRGEMRSKWKRDLPFEELLFNRWERAQSLGFGQGSSIYHNSYIFGDVQIGEDTWIGPFTLLDGTGGLSIGDHCSISAGVHIYTHDTVMKSLSGGKQPPQRAPVKIDSCCYIGSQSIIRKGVTIGDHVVIGAATFVNRDIPPYSIAVGSPCRIIGHVEMADEQIRLIYD